MRSMTRRAEYRDVFRNPHVPPRTLRFLRAARVQAAFARYASKPNLATPVGVALAESLQFDP